MPFPKDFLWGAATSAYQIEGATTEDSRQSCIWDTYAPGHTPYDETGEAACDHYHRFREDVALMKEMGLKSYRFSVAWPRIFSVDGKLNKKGLLFYVALVKALHNAGIEPMVTLYHWDMPQYLYDQGGWLNPQSPDWFAEYTRIVVKALSPWVRYWITLNEPQCFIGIAYRGAEHAPFLDQPASLLPATRNVLLAHGRSVMEIRQYAVTPPLIGFAPTGSVYQPEGMEPDQIERARIETFGNRRGPFSVAWWCDPVLLGKLPQGAAAEMGIQPEELFTPAQWGIVTQPLDFLGFNIYQTEGLEIPGCPYPSNICRGGPRTTMNWPVTPDALYWAVRFLQERYRLPILITENGMANTDFVMLDGKIHDPQRIDYIHRYLLGLQKAIDEGYCVLGYQYWSLMDNFEWAEGYRQRFGLIYVDYLTQRRILKDSAYWYKDIIRTNGADL